nr:MAG TPA: hypothetical protein [Caudoviricetes sp.]DAP02724.1 MAG TPA: hypothetical protein [Caudoviricetes sp.]DAR84966.1 MAG TPA: hypothetical protein [Caudoviricetes sp.]
MVTQEAMKISQQSKTMPLKSFLLLIGTLEVRYC